MQGINPMQRLTILHLVELLLQFEALSDSDATSYLQVDEEKAEEPPCNDHTLTYQIFLICWSNENAASNDESIDEKRDA
jgi:hypothetical protein